MIRAYGQHYRTIWLKEDDPGVVQAIDQRRLPHQFVVEDLASVEDVATRRSLDMHVRGAGLIGATAGYGMYLAALHAPQSSPEAFKAALVRDGARLRPLGLRLSTCNGRSTANCRPSRLLAATLRSGSRLRWLKRMPSPTRMPTSAGASASTGWRSFGRSASARRGQPVNILTHCNAGWLAFVDYGSATAPIYAAHDEGMAVHVWVDETRPRNQGAR